MMIPLGNSERGSRSIVAASSRWPPIRTAPSSPPQPVTAEGPNAHANKAAPTAACPRLIPDHSPSFLSKARPLGGARLRVFERERAEDLQRLHLGLHALERRHQRP